jgi:hypothetical protein
VVLGESIVLQRALIVVLVLELLSGRGHVVIHAGDEGGSVPVVS